MMMTIRSAFLFSLTLGIQLWMTRRMNHAEEGVGFSDLVKRLQVLNQCSPIRKKDFRLRQTSRRNQLRGCASVPRALAAVEGL